MDGGEGTTEKAKAGAWARRVVAARLRSKRALAAVAAVIVIAVAGVWWHSTRYESTDDAQVDGHIDPVSARVSGHVVRVNVTDNQFVPAGTVIVEIDPADYRVALERKRANYADALAAASAARVTVPITSVTAASRLATARAGVASARAEVAAAGKRLDALKARLREAEANDARAQADLARYAKLVARDVVSRQLYEHSLATAKTSAASVDAARATVVAGRQEVAQARGRLDEAEAELAAARTAPQQVAVSRARAEGATAAVAHARAALDQAELNLRYTRVVAPESGIVGRKTVEVGQNVQPGQVLLSIVPLEDIWVTANFKETQLKRMRPGQRVTIYVDAYRKRYAGYVESIGAASGSRFSLFPPENATGNYVKVVQRIPVRIRFDKGQDRQHLLRPGMSVVPRVRVR